MVMITSLELGLFWSKTIYKLNCKKSFYKNYIVFAMKLEHDHIFKLFFLRLICLHKLYFKKKSSFYLSPIHLVSASSSSNCLFTYLNLFININTFLAGMLRKKQCEAIWTQTNAVKINNFMLKAF